MYYCSNPINELLKLPMTRDEFLSYMEYEDACLAAVLTKEWESSYGQSIRRNGKYKTVAEREAAMKPVIEEAKYRERRAEYYKTVHAGSGSDDEKAKVSTLENDFMTPVSVQQY